MIETIPSFQASGKPVCSRLQANFVLPRSTRLTAAAADPTPTQYKRNDKVRRSDFMTFSRLPDLQTIPPARSGAIRNQSNPKYLFHVCFPTAFLWNSYAFFMTFARFCL